MNRREMMQHSLASLGVALVGESVVAETPKENSYKVTDNTASIFYYCSNIRENGIGLKLVHQFFECENLGLFGDRVEADIILGTGYSYLLIHGNNNGHWPSSKSVPILTKTIQELEEQHKNDPFFQIMEVSNYPKWRFVKHINPNLTYLMRKDWQKPNPHANLDPSSPMVINLNQTLRILWGEEKP